MAAMRNEARLVRTLRMVRTIAQRRHGIRVVDLVEELGVSRNSVYRYLDDLTRADVGLLREQRNGEAWVRLPPQWSTQPDMAERFALVVARQALAGLSGSKAQRWLEPRLQDAPPPPLAVEAAIPVDDGVARAVETALAEPRRRLSFVYRGLNDGDARRRVVEPIELRFSQRAWYLFGFDVDKGELRTFKLARMNDAQVERATCTRTVVDAAVAHAHSVSVWSSPETYDVVIRIYPPHAAVAHEYPLQASQSIERDGDTVVVRATVAGLEEVTRWVLRWGGDARVEAPDALRRRMRTEHERALKRLS
jgi:predicted DNA-binding transcriptional regulator YafY